MGDNSYIYGDGNGATFDGVTSESPRQTNWDPRIEVRAVAHTVNVGVVPASEDSTDTAGVWKSEEGQYLTLSRDGLNRLIRALQEAGAATFGRDAW